MSLFPCINIYGRNYFCALKVDISDPEVMGLKLKYENTLLLVTILGALLHIVIQVW